VSDDNQEANPIAEFPYRSLAQSLIDQLRAYRQQIPRFTFSPEKHFSKRMITLASVPAEFIQIVSTSVGNAPELTSPGLASSEDLRDRLSFSISFTAVVDEMAAMTNATRYTVTEAFASAAADALIIYALAKRLARHPENSHLIPLVENMRKALGRTRPHSRKKATPTEDGSTQTTIESPEAGSSEEK
jgi:hypothetical protein